MKSWNAAALALVIGVGATWFGADRVRTFFRSDACKTCPHDAVDEPAPAVKDAARATCPAHREGDRVVADDKAAVDRARLALRDGIFAPWSERGRAPTKDEVRARLQLDGAGVDALFATLEACGTATHAGIRLVPGTDVIGVAWPFANVPTGIDVAFDARVDDAARDSHGDDAGHVAIETDGDETGAGPAAHALSAVDALGASALLGKRATIDAATADDHAVVHIVVDGAEVVDASPADLLVMSPGISRDGDGNGDDESLFFSSKAGVDAWSLAHPKSAPRANVWGVADATVRAAAIFARITKGLPSAGVEVAAVHVEPWEPVDEGFRGCEQSCGARASGPEADVVVQGASTQAKIGDKVYCPVSGVVFTVSDKSATRVVAGRTVYFCCESCAAFFSAHEPAVLAARGLTPA